MPALDISFEDSHRALPDKPRTSTFCSGGLFLDPSTLPSSVINTISGEFRCYSCRPYSRRKRAGFLSLSLSIKGKDEVITNSAQCAAVSGGTESTEAVLRAEKRVKVRLRGRGAVNTTKHLWAGAVAAMVSRCFFFVSVFYLFRSSVVSQFIIDASASSEFLRIVCFGSS